MDKDIRILNFPSLAPDNIVTRILFINVKLTQSDERKTQGDYHECF